MSTCESRAGDAVRAARQAVAVADLGARWGQVLVSGEDRIRFLHSLTTNDLATMRPGDRGEGALLTPQGKVLFYFDVYVRDGEVILQLPTARCDALRATLERYRITEDVLIQGAPSGASRATSCAVLGPTAADWLRGWSENPLPAEQMAALPGLATNRFVAPTNGGPMVASAAPTLGAPGFLLLGASLPSQPAVPRLTDDALEALRIEAGIPHLDAEFFKPILPQEGGLADRVLSFGKGCYLGQEPVAMLHYRGKLRRRLRGVRLGPGVTDVPQRDDAILLDGHNVGRVTSAVRSPTLGRTIAMAILKDAAHESGTEVVVLRGGAELPGQVGDLPFVDPNPS